MQFGSNIPFCNILDKFVGQYNPRLFTFVLVEFSPKFLLYLPPFGRSRFYRILKLIEISLLIFYIMISEEVCQIAIVCAFHICLVSYYSLIQICPNSGICSNCRMEIQCSACYFVYLLRLLSSSWFTTRQNYRHLCL